MLFSLDKESVEYIGFNLDGGRGEIEPLTVYYGLRYTGMDTRLEGVGGWPRTVVKQAESGVFSF